MPASQTIQLFPDKQCGGSVRYAVPENQKDKAAVTNVYVSRTFANPMPESITITVAAGAAAVKAAA